MENKKTSTKAQRAAEAVQEIAIPEGISCTLNSSGILVEGSGSKLHRRFVFGNLNANVEGKKIVVKFDKYTKREKTLFGTLEAVLNLMFEGIKAPFVYKLKICSGHFPMNASIVGKDFVVKNFLGEVVPRKAPLPEGVKVKVEGDIVLVESRDKDLAGNTAGQIEILTKISNRDSRIFQDGIYIIQKSNKLI